MNLYVEFAMDFKEKVVIVTGASSGIGARVALDFAKLGGSLALVGRDKHRLEATKDAIVAANGTMPLVIQADLTNDCDVKFVIDETVSKFGRIDVLVNNAGILEMGSIETTNMKQYDIVMNTNIRAPFYLTTLAVPFLISAKGNIVNVSSVNGIRSFPGVLAYNISKAAMDQFTRCVALELAAKGVRCNSVNPGVTITEIHKNAGMDEPTYAKFLEHSGTTHALGRPGRVDEISNVIMFLASERASFITGASLPVDGGRHAMCPR